MIFFSFNFKGDTCILSPIAVGSAPLLFVVAVVAAAAAAAREAFQLLAAVAVAAVAVRVPGIFYYLCFFGGNGLNVE